MSQLYTQNNWHDKTFQSTSSEEDVVSGRRGLLDSILRGFNPRPPKRTLCLCNVINDVGSVWFQSTSSEEDVVSPTRRTISP